MTDLLVPIDFDPDFVSERRQLIANLPERNPHKRRVMIGKILGGSVGGFAFGISLIIAVGLYGNPQSSVTLLVVLIALLCMILSVVLMPVAWGSWKIKEIDLSKTVQQFTKERPRVAQLGQRVAAYNAMARGLALIPQANNEVVNSLKRTYFDLTTEVAVVQTELRAALEQPRRSMEFIRRCEQLAQVEEDVGVLSFATGFEHTTDVAPQLMTAQMREQIETEGIELCLSDHIPPLPTAPRRLKKA